MLSSVFNRRKVQKKLNTLAHKNRAQSPPSPASFVSPEIDHDDIDPNSLQPYGTTKPSSKGTPPQVHLLLDRSDSISEWFPPELLRGCTIEPPSRGISLAKSALEFGEYSRKEKLRNGRERCLPMIPADEVIVIGHEPLASGLPEKTISERANVQARPSPANRRPAPTPLTIPDSLTPSRVTLQRSSSASGHQDRSLSRSPSRPLSSSSDGVMSSASSGTTLARALLVDAFIISNDLRQSRYKGTVTRQDSTILPSGEFHYSGAVVTSASDEAEFAIPPVPPLPPGIQSALDSAGTSQSRRNSTNIAEARRQSEARLNGHIPSAASPTRKRASNRYRQRSPSLPRIQSLRKFSRVYQGSSSPMSPTGGDLVASEKRELRHPLSPSWRSSPIAQRQSGLSDRRPRSASEPVVSPITTMDSDQPHELARKRQSYESNRQPSRGSIDSPPPGSVTSASAYSPGMSQSDYSQGMAQSPEVNVLSASSSESQSFAIHRAYSNQPAIQVPPRASFKGRVTHGNFLRASTERRQLPPSAVPVSARLFRESPVDSPDLLDFIIPKSALILDPPPASTLRRSVSHLPPIAVPLHDRDDTSSDSLGSTSQSGSSYRQTFPETPYAFTPLISAGFQSQVPLPARPSPRMKSLQRAVSTKNRPKYLLRSFSSAGERMRQADKEKKRIVDLDEFLSPPASSGLSAIEEKSPSQSPTSQISQAVSQSSSSPSPDPPLVTTSPPSSAITTEGSTSPLSHLSSPNTTMDEGAESGQSAGKGGQRTFSSQTPPHGASPLASLVQPTPVNDYRRYSLTTTEEPSSLDNPFDNQAGPSSRSPSRLEDLPLDGISLYRNATPEGKKRGPRSRPKPPSGPRKPSAPNSIYRMRDRNGSVTSVHSAWANSPQYATGFVSAPIPKFQSSQISLRGLTMETAQWTLSSSELQGVVSRSIKQWADPSSMRLLHPDVLENKLTSEKERVEALNAELKTKYRLAVGKRNSLMSSLAQNAEFGDLTDPVGFTRTFEELSEVNESIDRLSEDLCAASDQLTQLASLEGAHHSSALGMALRKLNTSFVKYMKQNNVCKQRIAELEAERDDGWEQAEELARQLEEKEPGSRRSSKISMARKSSVRALKAGLRSPARHRSQTSLAPSPARRSPNGIPPVPPVPSPKSLGIVTTDLPVYTPEFSPSSEANALLEAQRELCEMLGITLEDLQPTGLPKRRVSAGGVSSHSPVSSRARRNSDVVSPTFRTKDERPNVGVM